MCSISSQLSPETFSKIGTFVQGSRGNEGQGVQGAWQRDLPVWEVGWVVESLCTLLLSLWRPDNAQLNGMVR